MCDRLYSAAISLEEGIASQNAKYFFVSLSLSFFFSSSRLIAPNQKTSNRAPRIVQPRGVSTELQRTTREDAGEERTGTMDGREKRERARENWCDVGGRVTIGNGEGGEVYEGAGERVPILAQSRRPQNERRYYALVAWWRHPCNLGSGQSSIILQAEFPRFPLPSPPPSPSLCVSFSRTPLDSA